MRILGSILKEQVAWPDLDKCLKSSLIQFILIKNTDSHFWYQLCVKDYQEVHHPFQTLQQGSKEHCATLACMLGSWDSMI